MKTPLLLIKDINALFKIRLHAIQTRLLFMHFARRKSWKLDQMETKTTVVAPRTVYSTLQSNLAPTLPNVFCSTLPNVFWKHCPMLGTALPNIFSHCPMLSLAIKKVVRTTLPFIVYSQNALGRGKMHWAVSKNTLGSVGKIHWAVWAITLGSVGIHWAV